MRGGRRYGEPGYKSRGRGSGLKGLCDLEIAIQSSSWRNSKGNPSCGFESTRCRSKYDTVVRGLGLESRIRISKNHAGGRELEPNGEMRMRGWKRWGSLLMDRM